MRETLLHPDSSGFSMIFLFGFLAILNVDHIAWEEICDRQINNKLSII